LWGINVAHFKENNAVVNAEIRVEGAHGAVLCGFDRNSGVNHDLKIVVDAKRCCYPLLTEWGVKDVTAIVFADFCMRPVFIHGTTGADVKVLSKNQQSTCIIGYGEIVNSIGTENVKLLYKSLPSDQNLLALDYDPWPPGWLELPKDEQQALSTSRVAEALTRMEKTFGGRGLRIALQWNETRGGRLKDISIILDVDNSGPRPFASTVALYIADPDPDHVHTLDGFEVCGIDKQDQSGGRLFSEAGVPFSRDHDEQKNVHVHDLHIDFDTVLPLRALKDTPHIDNNTIGPGKVVVETGKSEQLHSAHRPDSVSRPVPANSGQGFKTPRGTRKPAPA